MAQTRFTKLARATAVASVLAAAACGSADEDGSSDTSTQPQATAGTTDPPDETSPTEPPATNAVSQDSTPIATEPIATEPPVDSLGSESSFVPDAPVVTRQFESLDPGTYRVDTLGTPFSFTTTEPRYVQPNGDGVFVLTHQYSSRPDDRDIVFVRPSDLSDPSATNVSFRDAQELWPVDDFPGWLDALPAGIEVSERTDIVVGGLPAVSVDVSVGDVQCVDGPQECVAFASVQLVNSKFLNPGASYRIYVVEQGGDDPIAIVVGTTGDQPGWLDVADDILSTLSFGDVIPNPAQLVEPGSYEFDLLGGISVDISSTSVVVENTPSAGRLFPGDAPADIDFLVGPATLDRTSIESTDDLVETLRSAEVQLDEVESDTVGELPARVFALSSGQLDGPVLFRGTDDERGWFAPPLGRMWAIEHPDRGLLMITAEAFVPDDELAATIAGQASALVSTLVFVDPA